MEAASDGRLPTVRDWWEPIVFDVFEPDGRYLGQVSAPPIMVASHLYFATRDKGLICARPRK